MSAIRTLIVEDEPLAAESLADWVKDTAALSLLQICPDGPTALVAIRQLQPQLVFMDINMPGMSGLQVLRQLAQSDTDPQQAGPAVIFTTAYDEHALAAFELHAADYLLKPFSRERFNEAVDHALTLIRHTQQRIPLEALARDAQLLNATPSHEPLQRILVRDQGRIFPLQVEQIEYLRSDTKYTALHCRGREFLVRLPIASFEQQLDPLRFLKLQRSCIVNLDFVDSMTPDENSQLVVQMRDGSRFTASREVSKRLREQSL